MKVVSDTSVISNLINIDALIILKELFEVIIIPNAVYNELVIIDAQQKTLHNNRWIKVANLNDVEFKNKLLQNLGKGEAEVIAYANDNDADLILMDERKGRKIAKSNEIRTTGILGLLLSAKEKNIISAVKPLLDSLVFETSFYISSDLYKEVLKISEER